MTICQIYHAQGRFKNFYGEVNSYLRFCFDDLRVGKKGVIYRNPYGYILE